MIQFFKVFWGNTWGALLPVRIYGFLICVNFKCFNIVLFQVVPNNGHVPNYHSQPNGGWERIQERPTFYTSSSDDGGNNFIMSFRVLCEPNTTTYIAFTYPYSYKDLQTFISRLEKKHGGLVDKSFEALSKMPANSIYFHRENVCFSLEKRRIDLLTITGLNGLLPDREEKLEKLFPEHGSTTDKGRHILRPFKFSPSKKTIFVSARVHPGKKTFSAYNFKLLMIVGLIIVLSLFEILVVHFDNGSKRLKGG